MPKFMIEVPNGNWENQGWIPCVSDENVALTFDTREEAQGEARFSLGGEEGHDWQVVEVKEPKTF